MKAASRTIINLCANNYLGLADHPEIIAAAKAALDDYGYGMASVRFICGTLDLHRQLERAIAEFLNMDDAILYAAAFDANGGVFEPLLTADDAIVSDSLNHASIIDGIRLCKAQRFRFENNNMDDLADQAGASGGRLASQHHHRHGRRLLDGWHARQSDSNCVAWPTPTTRCCWSDDCHATGILGPGGQGTPAHFRAARRYHHQHAGQEPWRSGRRLRGGGPARSSTCCDSVRAPILFSNALPPMLVGGALKAIELARAG